MLKELANVTARPLLITFKRSLRSAEVPKDCKKVNDTPTFKKGRKEGLRNDRLVNFTSVPGKAIEQILLKTISKHMKAKKVMGSSQHRFMKGKLCLTNLTAFYAETGLVG